MRDQFFFLFGTRPGNHEIIVNTSKNDLNNVISSELDRRSESGVYPTCNPIFAIISDNTDSPPSDLKE